MSPSVSNLQDNQMFKFALVIFVSVVTAVSVSTAIIMSLLGGPSANAMTTQNNNTQSGVGLCVDTSADSAVAPAPVSEAAATSEGTASASPLLSPKATLGYVKPLMAYSISGSFNTTNSNSTSTITTTTNTNTYNTTTWTVKDNGNSYTANWNNGNSYSANWNNGNTNNQNNGNSSETTSTVNTTTNTTTNTSQNNGNTNNQNNGNTTENNPTTNTSTTTNTSQNNGNQDNDNNGNTYSAEASIF